MIKKQLKKILSEKLIVKLKNLKIFIIKKIILLLKIYQINNLNIDIKK